MIARLDCQAGIAGDMWVAAALDAGAPFALLEAAVAALDLAGVSIAHERVRRGGLSATRFVVQVDERSRAHRGLGDLLAIVARADLAEPVRGRVGRVLRALAEAEAAVHGIDVEQVHFHEVGGDDAIVDVVCGCLAFDALGIDRVEPSVIEVGTGTVSTEHGELPIPAPATARLLADLPVRQAVAGEATTPTGAALLSAFVSEPVSSSDGGSPRAVRQRAIGYGAGSREVDGVPNVLRLRLVEECAGAPAAPATGAIGSERPAAEFVGIGDAPWQIECQVDTATGERIGHVLRLALEAGAIDGVVAPVAMKKGRPGHLLTLWAHDATRDAVVRHLLEESTSSGVRIGRVERRMLPRWEVVVPTPWGSVVAKAIRRPSGQVTVRPEADEIERLVAAGHGSYAHIEEALTRAALELAESMGQD